MSLSGERLVESLSMPLPERLGMVAASCQRRADLYERKRQRAYALQKPLQVAQNEAKRQKWAAYQNTVLQAAEWIEAHL